MNILTFYKEKVVFVIDIQEVVVGLFFLNCIQNMSDNGATLNNFLF
jgi:hypothetical protein